MTLLELAVTLGAVGHFVVPLASVQVPHRLGWKEELSRLRPLNRKLVWVFGAFTVLTILSFGVLTALLRRELLAGDRAAGMLAAFIGVYWTARIGVDLFYYCATDWPHGRAIYVGHLMLLGLFASLATTYVAFAATAWWP
jgi:hypothetical protein